MTTELRPCKCWRQWPFSAELSGLLHREQCSIAVAPRVTTHVSIKMRRFKNTDIVRFPWRRSCCACVVWELQCWHSATQFSLCLQLHARLDDRFCDPSDTLIRHFADYYWKSYKDTKHHSKGLRLNPNSIFSIRRCENLKTQSAWNFF